MNRETRSPRRVDAVTRALRASRELRQRFVPRAGLAEYVDPVSINGQLWLPRCHSRGNLTLQRAKERREDMTAEKLQKERDVDMVHKQTRRKRLCVRKRSVVERMRCSLSLSISHHLRWR